MITHWQHTYELDWIKKQVFQSLDNEKDVLADRTKEAIEKALAGDADEAGYAATVSRNMYRGAIIVMFYLAGTPLEGYRDALESVWSHDHRQLIKDAGTRRRLRAIFKKAKFPLPGSLPDVVRVWRGTSYHTAKQTAKGLSWTTDRDVACWFAMRFAEKNGRPLVLAADVPRDAILHYSDCRNEAEALCFDVSATWIDGTPEDWQAGHDRYQIEKEKRNALVMGVPAVSG